MQQAVAFESRCVPIPVHVRWMIQSDMLAVSEIEARSNRDPWSVAEFKLHMRQRNVIGMIAETKIEEVAGFMVYELHENHLTMLNFAVSPRYRRRDIGSQMIKKLISKLCSHRRTYILAEVRETNLPAQLFFKSLGFHAISVERGFFGDTGEDAFVMEYELKGGR